MPAERGWVRLNRGADEALGALDAPAFLEGPGEVVSGHPARHVRRVRLPDGSMGFLKREHVVPWRDRMANFLAGFGFVSKSEREAIRLSGVEALLTAINGTGDDGPAL